MRLVSILIPMLALFTTPVDVKAEECLFEGEGFWLTVPESYALRTGYDWDEDGDWIESELVNCYFDMVNISGPLARTPDKLREDFEELVLRGRDLENESSEIVKRDLFPSEVFAEGITLLKANMETSDGVGFRLSRLIFDGSAGRHLDTICTVQPGAKSADSEISEMMKTLTFTKQVGHPPCDRQ